MPTARNHAAVGVVNNKIYVIGGRVGAAFMSTPASATDLVEEYDPASDQWGPLKKSMPTPRSAMSWGTHNGWIYVVGGEARDEKLWGAFVVVEALDPVGNRLRRLGGNEKAGPHAYGKSWIARLGGGRDVWQGRRPLGRGHHDTLHLAVGNERHRRRQSDHGEIGLPAEQVGQRLRGAGEGDVL